MKNEEQAAAQVQALLALPTIPADGMYSDGECFDPWDIFPAVYGSYSSEFDTLALDVLSDIHAGAHTRDDLASEIFREMLCTAELCTYGTSPRVCFPTPAFAPLLPALIERWRQYAAVMWGAEIVGQPGMRDERPF